MQKKKLGQGLMAIYAMEKESAGNNGRLRQGALYDGVGTTFVLDSTEQAHDISLPLQDLS